LGLRTLESFEALRNGAGTSRSAARGGKVLPPPPLASATVYGTTEVGRLAAAGAPFGSMVVTASSVELRFWKFGKETLVRGEGRVRVEERRNRLFVSFEYDNDRTSSYRFQTTDHERARWALLHFGWQPTT
jgi:hypothetical protein